MADEDQKFGLTVLYEPSIQAPELDIVAVHGLNGHYLKSWTEPKSHTLWLQDLLPLDFPEARIMTYSYESRLVNYSKQNTIARLDDIGQLLLGDLEALRSTTNTQSRPIVFVAHSVGGLVVKEALSQFSTPASPNRITAHTAGILFFATPHRGTDSASLAKMLMGILSVVASTNTSLIRNLRVGSEEIAYLNSRFVNVSKDMCIYNFYETIDTSTVGKVVTKESAFMGLPNETLRATRASHMSINKFESKISPDYISIVSAIMDSLNAWILRRESERVDQETSNLSRIPTTIENFPAQRRLPTRSARPNIATTSIRREPAPRFVFDTLADSEGVETGSALAEVWFRDLTEQVLPIFEERYKDSDVPIKIAIIDSGVDGTHPLLQDYFERGQIRYKSFIEGEEGNVDVCGHGTHMTDLVLRVAPKAHVFVERVFISGQAPEMERNKNLIEKAIRYATHEEKVDIISMSWGYRTSIPEISSAIRDAFHHLKILLAAASNSGGYAKNNVAFPASMRQVICINSTDGFGNPSELNPSPSHDRTFMVIGEGLAAACPLKLGDSELRVIRGTSAATAIATGIAALILQYSRYYGNRGQRVQQPERLDCDGMRKIFAGMAEERGNYHLLVPAKMFHETGEDRHFRVCQNLSRLLDAL